jgi:hypothetical protein
MRVRAILVGLAALAAMVAFAATAVAGSGTDRVTGGGQVLFSDQGAGNTIAFTAQGTSDDARGQVQVNDRANQVKFHGIVNCLNVMDNMAVVSGTNRDDGSPFQLYVIDNGQGVAADDDIVTLRQNASGDCSDPEDEPDDSDALARGNAQVYDAP